MWRRQSLLREVVHGRLHALRGHEGLRVAAGIEPEFFNVFNPGSVRNVFGIITFDGERTVHHGVCFKARALV
jgi:hypothetical protein